MDWQTVVLNVYSLDASIVAVIVTLAVFIAYVVHHFFETGVYWTLFVIASMSIVGSTGHILFLLNDIIFSYDAGRNVVVGSTIAMGLYGFVGLAVHYFTVKTIDEVHAPRQPQANVGRAPGPPKV